MHALLTRFCQKVRGARWLLFVVAVGFIGCIDTPMPLDPTLPAGEGSDGRATSGGSVASSGPLFLEFDAQAPALENQDTTIVAVAGQDMRLRMLFQGLSGSDRFLELEFDEETLWRYPAAHPRAGAPFQPGDTVTITVAVDPVTLAVTLGPEGLELNPDEPAELELGYRFADPDFDGDGTPDPGLVPTIKMFRQATPADPFLPLDSEIDLLDQRVEFKDLRKFSRYALAI